VYSEYSRWYSGS